MRLFQIIAVVALSGAVLPAFALDEVLLVNNDIAPRYCKSKSSYLARDESYKIIVPDFGKKIFVEDRDITPKITVHTTFAAPDTGFLFIVSTRIRDDLPKDSSILDRVEKRYAAYSTNYVNAFSSKWSEGKFGRYYEFVFLNVSAPPGKEVPYPIGLGYLRGSSLDVVERVGVHRFFVANRYLYEFAVLLHTKGTLANKPKEDLVAQGYEWIDKAMSGFIPGRFKTCNE